jgi:hypothetical protein
MVLAIEVDHLRVWKLRLDLVDDGIKYHRFSFADVSRYLAKKG